MKKIDRGRKLAMLYTTHKSLAWQSAAVWGKILDIAGWKDKGTRYERQI